MTDDKTYPAETSVLRSPDGEVYVWFEYVGPERAKQLLKTYRVDYRKMRPTHRDTLARDMENGYWQFDGSPGRIDEKGNLLDSQHRLHAIIQSNTTQLMLFVGGLPVKAYDTIDQGLPRNYGDLLRKRGYNNVSARTAITKLIARWEEGKSLDATSRYTNSELDMYHDRYGDTITRAIASTMGASRKVDMPPAMISFLWWLLSRIDSNDAYTFMTGVIEGENLRSGMPAKALRDRLRRERDTDLSRMDYAHLTFQAWNAFREGVNIHRLHLTQNVLTRNRLIDPK